MSTRPVRRRQAEEEGDDRGRRRSSRPRKSNAPVVAGMVFALAVVAIGAAGWLNRDKAKASEAGPKQTEEEVYGSPFADLPPETAPQRMSPGGKPTLPIASRELLQDPIWADATKRSEEVFRLVDEAEAAKTAGDHDLYVEKAVAARDSADELLFATSDWVAKIEEEHGPNDPVVREVTREFGRWSQLLRKYHGLSKD